MINPESLASSLQSHMHKNNLTQAQAAKKLNVSQASISRILNCDWTRRTSNIQRVSSILGMNTEIDPRQNAELMRALSEVWNGEEEDARALAKCIRAIGEARKKPSSNACGN